MPFELGLDFGCRVFGSGREALASLGVLPPSEICGKQFRKDHEAMTASRRSARLAIPKDRIAEFCRRWKIVELSLFGSALREDFSPRSDVDVLVAFAPEVRRRFDDLLDMRDELEEIFGRRVDLVEKRLVEESENYIRRNHILNNAEAVYVA